MSRLPPVLALVVLYGMTGEQSTAFKSLQTALTDDPELQDSFEVMIFDNSPTVQASPAGFTGLYLRDTANPGLATAYNAALQHATTGQWLLLLDQDTTVTVAYLREVLLETGRAAPELCALVPRLMRGKTLFSPHIPPFTPPGEIADDLYGVLPRRLHMFNSGAVLRVANLTAIGGFPAEFPLDSLDHATFQLLQRAGGKVFLLHATLHHSLSQEEEQVSPARHRSILASQTLYYRLFGMPREQRSFRRDLLRQASVALRSAAFSRAGRLLLAAARSGGSR